MASSARICALVIVRAMATVIASVGLFIVWTLTVELGLDFMRYPRGSLGPIVELGPFALLAVGFGVICIFTAYQSWKCDSAQEIRLLFKLGVIVCWLIWFGMMLVVMPVGHHRHLPPDDSILEQMAGWVIFLLPIPAYQFLIVWLFHALAIPDDRNTAKRREGIVAAAGVLAFLLAVLLCKILTKEAPKDPNIPEMLDRPVALYWYAGAMFIAALFYKVVTLLAERWINGPPTNHDPYSL
jgi:hypothetical protein